MCHLDESSHSKLSETTSAKMVIAFYENLNFSIEKVVVFVSNLHEYSCIRGHLENLLLIQFPSKLLFSEFKQKN